MTQRRPVLAILGASGLVGGALQRAASVPFDLLTPAHAEVDALDADSLARFIRSCRADVLVNLVAGTDVDGAERERGDENGLAYRLNVVLVRRLTDLCRQTGMHLVHVSTDYVFDGEQATRPYVESDTPGPLNWYAHTKLLGEQEALRGGDAVCVARIEMPFTGEAARKLDFPRLCVQRLTAGQHVDATVDQKVTPSFLADTAAALSFLAETRVPDVVHVAAASWTTPFDFARAISDRLGLATSLVRPLTYREFLTQRPAPRPQHSWLDVGRFHSLSGAPRLHAIEEAVDLFARQVAG